MKIKTAFFLAFVFCLAPCLRAECGVGRWSIKTASDAEAAAFPGLDQAADVTISEIHYWHGGRPYTKGELQQRMGTRINSQERTLYRVRGFLRDYKANSEEGDDNDLQLIVSDGSGNSVQAFLPPPDCAPKSHFLEQLKSARAAFEAHHLAGPEFLKAPINEPIEIVGPAFFAIPRGQVCCARNFAEIQPVLKISFGEPQASGASSQAAGEAGPGTCLYKGEAYSSGALECMFGHMYECAEAGKWRPLKGEKCQ